MSEKRKKEECVPAEENTTHINTNIHACIPHATHNTTHIAHTSPSAKTGGIYSRIQKAGFSSELSRGDNERKFQEYRPTHSVVAKGYQPEPMPSLFYEVQAPS